VSKCNFKQETNSASVSFAHHRLLGSIWDTSNERNQTYKSLIENIHLPRCLFKCTHVLQRAYYTLNYRFTTVQIYPI